METGISLERAVALLTAGVVPLGTETLPLVQALGRTLAIDVTAPIDNPPFDRSPLDGYALRAADVAGAGRETPVTLTVVDTVYAGGVPKVPLHPGQAARVMTGAMLPANCDCVVKQEDTDRGFPTVTVFTSLRPYENYVRRAEDYRAGSALLAAGTKLDAAALGVLSGAGVGEIAVRRMPSAAVLSTGDEVVAPGTAPLPAGRIYDANGPLLSARLRELGLIRVSAEHVGDDPAAAATAMARLLGTHDLLLTTGGVSVGDRDILPAALPLLGAEQVFHRINLKPGSPALFSRWRDKPILSLSGNPFAAVATFELLARPLLAALAGSPALLPRPARAVLDTPYPKSSSVRRFLRGRWENGHVTLPESHAAGVLSSLIGCGCLVDVPAGSPPLAAGQRVDILLL